MRKSMIKLNLNPFAVIIKWPLWYKNFDGFAIAPFAFVKDMNDKETIKHELVHVRQAYCGLWIGFALTYFYWLWKYGYENNPYEVEARKIAKL